MATDSETLFPASLISTTVTDALPEGFSIRPLSRDDYGKGFYDCLRVLTWVGEPTENEFLAQFDEMKAAKNTYFFAVVEYQGRVVGTGCLVAEKKL
jgi:glucosamine-phosphate N-acetyltransferase